MMSDGDPRLKYFTHSRQNSPASVNYLSITGKKING